MKSHLSFVAFLLLVPSLVTAQPSPRQVADELLAADRAFSAASAKTDLVSGLTAMFANDVSLTYAGGIAEGSVKATEALKANPVNAGAKIEWAPARVSVSGDGHHGFTAGFMTMRAADGNTTLLKYLAYWEKQQGGWRVLAYKRGVAKMPPPQSAVSYLLPAQVASSATDGPTLEGYRTSLADAERSFSLEAQTMGIGPAFRKYGSPDAINLAGPDVPGFLMGNDQIGTSVGGEAPAPTSPVSWGPEKTIVAASGDFGVTIGYIVANAAGPDGKPQPRRPFFTIWHRAGADAPWRYIAE